MLLHNLKIAVRNLLKYKLQTTISVLSIAIGIVVLATVHGILQLHLQAPQISDMPYYDRACKVTFDLLQTENNSGSGDIRPNAEIIRAIENGGELQTADMQPTFPNGLYTGYDTRFALGDTLARNYRVNILPIEKSYPNYAGYRSAITGEHIGVLKPGEAIMNETTAQIMFGDISPVGATFSMQTMNRRTFNLTIVDVYRDLGNFDSPPDSKSVLFALNDDDFMEVYFDKHGYMAPWLNIVLKEGCTKQQLEQELNMRLEPLGMKSVVELVKDDNAEIMTIITATKTIAYLLGSLILLAACICFLRMQMQLFYMRKRELSLRIVNGAKRWQLFMLLMTEVALVIIASALLALMMGDWLEHTVNTFFFNIAGGKGFIVMENLLQYSAFIGGAVLLVCGIIVWITLAKICKNAQGLAANMRGARTHSFRNTMLWLQVTVGMLFVSAAFVMATMCDQLLQDVVLPEDDTRYRESIFIRSSYAENSMRMYDELSKLPDVAQVIPVLDFLTAYKEIIANDSIQKRYGVYECFHTHHMKDTALLDYYDVQIHWTRPELKGEGCILIHEKLYPILNEAGILDNGVLTLERENVTLPVAGTFKDILFSNKEGRDRENFIVINPTMKGGSNRFILVPVKGRYNALWSDVQNTIARLEPTVVTKMAFNFYESTAPQSVILKYVRLGGWILGSVALLVCIMGIYSTIALDTRARRKEVAIRKINGAKPKDIAMIFVRLYIILIVLAMAVIIPLAFITSHALGGTFANDMEYSELPIIELALVGCLIVIISIALIVGWKVKEIMRINPVEMIVKE